MAATYSPSRAIAARFRLRTPGRRQLAKHARAYARLERRVAGILRDPRRARWAEKLRALGPRESWPEEWQYISRMALGDTLGNPELRGYSELYVELVEDTYRERYNAQRRELRRAEKELAA